MKFKSLFVTITIAVASASASSQQDVISTISGAGPSGMPAINANLNQVGQIALDAQGNYYFAAYSQNRFLR